MLLKECSRVKSGGLYHRFDTWITIYQCVSITPPSVSCRIHKPGISFHTLQPWKTHIRYVFVYQETMCRIFTLVCLVMSENMEICSVRRMDFCAFQLILEDFATIKSSKIFMKRNKGIFCQNKVTSCKIQERYDPCYCIPGHTQGEKRLVASSHMPGIEWASCTPEPTQGDSMIIMLEQGGTVPFRETAPEFLQICFNKISTSTDLRLDTETTEGNCKWPHFCL